MKKNRIQQPLLRLRQQDELLARPPTIKVNTNWTITKDTGPINATSAPPSNASCVMWVHLQASICTEWEHSSMVLSVEAERPDHQNVSSIIQALNKPEKRPKTIHRCILQRMTPMDGSLKELNCHVCGSNYPSYKDYLAHLLNNTCVVKTNKDPSPPLQPDIEIEAEIINGRKRELKKCAADNGMIEPTLKYARRDYSATNKNNNDELIHGRVEATLTSLCPHFAAATQTSPVALSEFVSDQAVLATIKVQLTTLLAGLMGEEKLTAIGYPDKDILTILNCLLQMARVQVLEPTEGCTSVCPRLEAVLAPNQVKYRLLKCQLTVARMNIARLLEICVPDKRLWGRNKWTEKSVEVILNEIISDQVGIRALTATAPDHEES